MVTKKSAKPIPAPEGQNPARARILEAAFAAFTERGFADTSTLGRSVEGTGRLAYL